MSRRRMDLLERLGTKVTVGDGCWEWSGAHGTGGYGRLSVGTPETGYQTQYAHRVLYELLVGPIPDGLVIDHLCFNKNCVRPDHLEPVTQQTNVQRALARV